MGFQLRCPECRDKFPWDPKATWPRYCPLCQADINNDRDDDDVVMPNILSLKTKRTDGVYDGMVKGSEFSAQAAAELAGVPVSEMSSLKITDLNTRRDAEIPPIATTTGAPAGPASRHAMDTESSVPPKCSLSSPGMASTPSRTWMPLADSSALAGLSLVTSLLIECSTHQHPI